MHVIVIGAGVIGALSAYSLQNAGAQVTLVDSGSANATSASFGWINASFFLNEHHFQLRNAALAAWRELCDALPLPICWSGCLSWEYTGDAFDQQLHSLQRLGYPVESVDAATFAQLEPRIAQVPERSLLLRDEAAADSAALARVLLDAAIARGAKLYTGVEVLSFVTEGQRVQGVQTCVGALRADKTLIAAGTGSAALSAQLNAAVPLLDRPALTIKTRPLAPTLRHVLATEFGEIRQLPSGELLMPTTVGHQADATTVIAAHIDTAAADALARLQKLLPGCDLALAEVSLANRPVPGDDLPVVGELVPGAYIATMHSGITLAALMGQLIASELLNGESADSRHWLSPYRPQRFHQA
ncbi:MAG: FAD-dependent oxidoreductase [Pseudomonadota bacterium]